MKKIFALLILMMSLSSCYEDYVKDFEYSAIYIPLQLDVRTFVVGEGMKFDIGVELGGVRENTRDRIVNFEVDNSMINQSALARLKGAASAYISSSCAPVTNLQALPSDYYSLSDGSRFLIMKGQHQGKITIKPDSVKFLSDAATLNPAYAIAIRLTGADADSLLYAKKTEIVGIRYENKLFGSYWHGGVTLVKDPTDANVIDTLIYYTEIPISDTKTWQLRTVGPHSLATNGYSNVTSGAVKEFNLTLDGGNITISSSSTGKYSVQPDGESTFNQSKLLQERKIYLKYKYVGAGGNWYHATDTLTFRNRIRDGVNEWMDENPSHYIK